MGVRALGAVAAVMLVVGSGCVTDDSNKSAPKRPDVTQLGVLPPPDGVKSAPLAQGGPVVPAGGTQAAPAPAATTGPTTGGPALPKLLQRPEKKVIATEMAVAWRSKVEYLPDPARNGLMGPGLAGQLFLFGGPKLEFAPADGVLTVDLVDETPRAPGQPASTPERWQFNKEMLRRLRTVDDTFGKSYVLFLPWPAYKPDITRVKISARYDPAAGDTLFAMPSTVTLSRDAPVWDGTKSSGLIGGPAVQLGLQPGAQPWTTAPMGPFPPQTAPPQPNFPAPIPLNGPTPPGAIPPGALPFGASAPAPSGAMPILPPAPPGAIGTPVLPPTPGAAATGVVPLGTVGGR
jgi:hypothetical protein